MGGDKLAEEIKTYRELGKQDKSIDVESLTMQAISKSEANFLSVRQKRWAYLISIGFPPFGLIFALKFYFSGKDDGKRAAITCSVLTVMSLFLAWLFASAILSCSNVNLEELQKISPQDIQELYQ